MAPMALIMRVAHGLYLRWDRLSSAERRRTAPFAEDVKQGALDLRGRTDHRAAEAELLAASERLAAELAESAERDPELDPADVARLRAELARELERLAHRDRAA